MEALISLRAWSTSGHAHAQLESRKRLGPTSPHVAVCEGSLPERHRRARLSDVLDYQSRSREELRTALDPTIAARMDKSPQ